MAIASFELAYDGSTSEGHVIDFYDVSRALIGFQRSLALTTHLVLNDEVITQAPSLKGAYILCLPAEPGSWKMTATVALSLVGGVWAIGTAPKDTPLGNLVSSAYDYVVSESLGFHVNYDKTLGQQFEEAKKSGAPVKELKQERFDSVIEKTESAIKEIHRPIVKSGTAQTGVIVDTTAKRRSLVGQEFNEETFDYMSATETDPESIVLTGRVSSYNINTYHGRIYLGNHLRPVPFELDESAQRFQDVSLIVNSLANNARSLRNGRDIKFVAYIKRSRNGRIKSLFVTSVLEIVTDDDDLI
jgi:hypothetical protein